VVLDHLALVPAAEDEPPEPVGRVRPHDVPEDRPVADGDHRLRTHVGLLAQPRAEPAAEDEDGDIACVHAASDPVRRRDASRSMASCTSRAASCGRACAAAARRAVRANVPIPPRISTYTGLNMAFGRQSTAKSRGTVESTAGAACPGEP